MLIPNLAPSNRRILGMKDGRGTKKPWGRSWGTTLVEKYLFETSLLLCNPRRLSRSCNATNAVHKQFLSSITGWKSSWSIMHFLSMKDEEEKNYEVFFAVTLTDLYLWYTCSYRLNIVIRIFLWLFKWAYFISLDFPEKDILSMQTEK